MSTSLHSQTAETWQTFQATLDVISVMQQAESTLQAVETSSKLFHSFDRTKLLFFVACKPRPCEPWLWWKAMLPFYSGAMRLMLLEILAMLWLLRTLERSVPWRSHLRRHRRHQTISSLTILPMQYLALDSHWDNHQCYEDYTSRRRR